MPIERIDSIWDIAALTAEQAKYLAILKESKDAIIDLNAQRVTAKSADLSNFTKAAQELDKAIAKTNATTEIGIKENARLQESVKAVVGVINQRMASEAKLATVATDYNKQTIANRTETQRLNKEIKNTVEAEQAAIGSRDRARAQIKVLTAAKDKLNLVNADERKEYDQIVVKLQRYEQFLKKTGSEAEKQRLNIGNYSGAVSVLKKSFEEVVVKMDGLTKAGKTNTDVFQQLEKEYTLLNKLVMSQEAGFANAAVEIRANQKALIDLENAGLSGTESFKRLEQATGDLQDQLGDLKARTKQLGSDTFVFDGLIEAAQGLAGAYGAAQGVAQLFGEDNEDLQKSMAKLQATMGIISGLQAVQNSLQQEGAAMLLLQDIRTKALAISQGIYAVAVGTSTGAMKLFRIALLATGIGAIIGLLYLAADAMGVFGDSAEDTTADLEAQTEAIKKNKESLEDIATAAEFERNRAKGGLNDKRRELELAEARGDSEAKIAKMKEEVDKMELANMRTKFYTFAGYADKQNEINEEGKDLANKIEADKLAFQKKMLDEAEKARKEKNDKARKAAEKAAADAKKFAEDEAKATFNIFRDNAEERARLAEIGSDDADAPLQKRLDALTEYYSERQSIIIAQKDFELKSLVKGSQQAAEIINKAEIDRNKLYEDIANKRVDITKAAQEKLMAAYKLAGDYQVARVEEEDQAIRDIKEKQYIDEVIALNNLFSSGAIAQDQYNKQRAKLDADYHKESIKTEIDHQKHLIEISDLSQDDKAKALRELAKLEKELSDQSVQDAEAAADAKKQAILKGLATISEVTNQTLGVIGSVIDASTIKQKNALREQSDTLEKNAAREVELVNASTLSEEKKAAQITVIRERLASQKEQIAQKERAADLQKARFDKAAAIMNIIINTASAVVKALPNIPLAVVAGVIGAAQLAVAIATPLPKYRHGRGEGKEEFALVHEGEYIHRASGKIEATPRVETLTHLMPKDKVYKNKATMMKELAMSAMPVINIANDQGADIERLASRIEDAVGNIKINTQIVTKQGWRMHNENLARYDKWVSRYIKN